MKVNTSSHINILLFIFIISFTLTMSVYAENVHCPPSIIVTEQIVTLPENWEGYIMPREHYLDSVMFSDGHPSTLSTLVPDKTTEKKGKSVSTWLFPSKDSGGLWLSCTYYNTNAIYYKRLPNGTKSCDVTSKLTKSGTYLHIESIVCK